MRTLLTAALAVGLTAATCAGASSRQVDTAPELAGTAATDDEACREGSPGACWQAGLALRDEAPLEAFERFERGCELGDGSCCDAVGVALSLGEGATRDAERAATYFERACDLESELGCYRAGRYHEACILGDEHGCLSAGFTSRLEATQTACATGDERLCRLGGLGP